MLLTCFGEVLSLADLGAPHFVRIVRFVRFACLGAPQRAVRPAPGNRRRWGDYAPRRGSGWSWYWVPVKEEPLVYRVCWRRKQRVVKSPPVSRGKPTQLPAGLGWTMMYSEALNQREEPQRQRARAEHRGFGGNRALEGWRRASRPSSHHRGTGSQWNWILQCDRRSGVISEIWERPSQSHISRAWCPRRFRLLNKWRCLLGQRNASRDKVGVVPPTPSSRVL